MADDLGDSRVAQDVPAAPDQVSALRQRYMPAASRAAAPKAPVTPDATPLVGKAAAAKTLQSATFGFGADAARVLMGKQAEQSIRDLSKQYDNDHPLASFGIDLAVAGAMSAVPVLGEAKDASIAATGLKMVGKSAGVGAAVGGLTGFGEGGDVGERTQKAIHGALAGGAVGAGAAFLGAAARPLAEKLGAASAQRSAAGAVQEALKADGKTMADLDAFMKANPNARIADFSPKVEEAIGKAASTTNKTARALGDVVRSDKEQQAARLTSGVEAAQPLLKTKQAMIDNIDKLQTQRQAAYTMSKTELTPITPELQRILDHPEVQPLFDKAVKDFGAGKRAGVADLQGTPKYKVGAEVPSAVLDDLQKAVGKAAQEEGTGSIRYGTLSAAQRAIKEQQTGTIIDAQALAAKLGGAESQTGLLGAQQWGHQYAFGLKAADIEQFRTMNAEQKEYAKLGMVDGMEKYLNDAGRMTEGSLTKIADKLRDPSVEEVLGAKGANDVRKVFQKEAARMRVSAQMERGGSRQAAFKEENEQRIVAHGLNVAVGGLSHIGGTAMRYLTAHGVSEKQALSMIDIASKPGGMKRLQDAGVDKRVLDIISSASKKGVVSGKVGAQQDIREQR